jgi:hypothetical protein
VLLRHQDGRRLRQVRREERRRRDGAVGREHEEVELRGDRLDPAVERGGREAGRRGDPALDRLDGDAFEDRRVSHGGR